MRSYEEQEKRAYEKAELLIEKKRRTAVFIRRSAAIALGAAVVLAVGIFTNAMKPPKPPVEQSDLVTESNDTTTSAVTAPSQESSGFDTSAGKTEKTTSAEETAGSGSDTHTETKTTAASSKTKSSETGKTTTVKTTKKSSKTTAKTSAVSTAKTKRTTPKTSRTSAATTKKTTHRRTSTTAICTTTKSRTTVSTQPSTETPTWQSDTHTYSPTTSTTATDSLGGNPYNNVTWTVTPIRDTITNIGGRFIGASPKEAAKYTNLVRGTITDITEYTVSWNDSIGQNRSIRVSVLDVRIDEVYYGSVSKRNLKIYYHGSVTNHYPATFLLRKGNEYFFLVREFGEEPVYGYLNTALHPENYADAYINMTNKAVFPVINGNVTFYDQFITKASDDIIKPDTIPVNEVSDRIPDEVRGEDWFCCLGEDEFIDYFTRMFDYYNQ